MPALAINEQTCTRCGLCATACLSMIISFPDGELPRYVDDDHGSRCGGALELPPEHLSIHCLMLGYPAIRYQRPPKRNPTSIVWR